jgi:dedicator of cytokinesis protein 1
MWECAIEICDELRQQYSEEMYNYSQLPQLLKRMATLYEKILKDVRFEPEYFRVAFFGRGFPSFLQDKVRKYVPIDYRVHSHYKLQAAAAFILYCSIVTVKLRMVLTQIFVYRGRRSEKLNDFETRMLERFPHAEPLRSLNRPSFEQRNSTCQRECFL